MSDCDPLDDLPAAPRRYRDFYRAPSGLLHRFATCSGGAGRHRMQRVRLDAAGLARETWVCKCVEHSARNYRRMSVNPEPLAVTDGGLRRAFDKRYDFRRCAHHDRRGQCRAISPETMRDAYWCPKHTLRRTRP